MSKGLFVTATGTDVGKTYVTALIIKKLREAGVNAGYYKAALSGAQSIAESDAGYVNRIARIGESEDMLLSYLYKNAYSPHLAARFEGRPVEMDEVQRGFGRAASAYEYLTVEGSGGIVCPIRKDEQAVIFLEDIIKALGLASVVVADSGLGTINAVVTTVEYMRSRGLRVKGVITSLLTSRVQLLITGASATIGIALNALTIVSPPAPHLVKSAAVTAIRYPRTEPVTSPPRATITVMTMCPLIVPKFSTIISPILVSSGSVMRSVPISLCRTCVCHSTAIITPNRTGSATPEIVSSSFFDFIAFPSR